MRLFTHTVFSFGVGALIFYIWGVLVDSKLLAAYGNQWWFYMLIVSWLGNHMIDRLGHGVTPQGYLTRLPRTHSIFTAPLWGALAAVIVTWALSKIWFLDISTYYLGAIEVGVFVAYSHLFLDAFTQSGIYFTTKRIDIMHLGYNNLIANWLAIAAGFISIYALVTPAVLNAILGVF